MMKKQYLLIPLFLVAIVTTTFAKTSTSSNVRARVEARKTEIEVRRASTTERRLDRREEIRSNIEQRRASSTERRVEFQQDLAKRRVKNVTKVLLATIERLEKIIVRIESRIEKINERGTDSTEAQSFVTLAKGNLADARLAVESFAGLDLSSTKAADNFETIRAAAAEARDSIRLAHQNLTKAARALKGPNSE